MRNNLCAIDRRILYNVFIATDKMKDLRLSGTVLGTMLAEGKGKEMGYLGRLRDWRFKDS